VFADFPASYRQLSRCITDQYGYPPREPQLRARLREGKRLLRETAWSVVTVALELGFSSPQHFSTVFRAREEVSPGRWRESTRGPNFRRLGCHTATGYPAIPSRACRSRCSGSRGGSCRAEGSRSKYARSRESSPSMARLVGGETRALDGVGPVHDWPNDLIPLRNPHDILTVIS
jgi:AraC-like DNA-binding protein